MPGMPSTTEQSSLSWRAPLKVLSGVELDGTPLPQSARTTLHSGKPNKLVRRPPGSQHCGSVLPSLSPSGGGGSEA